ncbi:MAG: hypothetical protein JXP34_27780 [Planctomycetes bacterium]|nr:hypothetical protein [Planctomycetota bacterium]
MNLLLCLAFASIAVGSAPHPSWGRLANPGFEGRRIRTTLFFAGQAKDGTNPYGCPSTPPANLSLYTVSPSDARHLRWSEKAANRDFALNLMVEAGINVVSMSTWGEAFLPCDESWSLWAPMQTSPASRDELFAAAAGKPLLIVPFIESRANWNFYNEFPRWTDGRVAPGTVSQIIELIERYLKNTSHPEWAGRWARVFDATGSERYAVALIHAASNRLGPSDHKAYAEGFDLIERAVFAATGVHVGFFIDALPSGSNAPGAFKPIPSQTGPYLRETRSILGIQCFIPEIWMTGSPSDAARLKWKGDFAKSWILTGIPFLMDVSPGYDAHIVFPGSVRYGLTEAWLSGLADLVRAYSCDGLVYNSWNGYTEAMAAVPLRAADGGTRYFDWLKGLELCEIFLRGDANADDAIDLADAVFVLMFIFAKGPVPPCLDAADGNDSGGIDIGDAVAILDHLFAKAGPLPDPFEGCDADPTPDRLDCEDFPPCGR